MLDTGTRDGCIGGGGGEIKFSTGSCWGGKKRGCPKRQVPTVDERYEVNYGGEGVSLGHLGRVVGAHEKVVVTRKVGEV